MNTALPSRRSFLAGSALSLAAAPMARAAGTGLPVPEGAGDRSFAYEIQRTDEEWRAMLSRDEYVILRGGSTELPHTSPLVEETRTGIYRCKGCGLDIYDSVWKEPLDIGYVFFRQSVENAVLLGTDGQPAYGRDNSGFRALIEVHCRRCGSHLGHIVSIDNWPLHCINGTALTFPPIAE